MFKAVSPIKQIVCNPRKATGGKALTIVVECMLMFWWVLFLRHSEANYTVYLFLFLIAAVCEKECCGLATAKADGTKSEQKWYAALAVFLSVLITTASYSCIITRFASAVTCVFVGLFITLAGYLIWRNVIYGCAYVLDNAHRWLILDEQRETAHYVAAFFIPFIACAAVFISYLFLADYPGILTWDSTDQLSQAVTGKYNSHHPIYHTLLISGAFHLGMMLFNNNAGAIATYTVFQVIIMAAVFAYEAQTLYLMRFKLPVIVVVTLLFIFIPYNYIYATIIWKDVLFAGMAALFVTAFIRAQRGIGRKEINALILFFSAIGFCVLRHNGLFAFALLMIIMLVHFLATRKALLQKVQTGALTAALVISVLLSYPVISALNLPETYKAQGLCIPVQQVARTAISGKELTNEERSLIQEIIDIDELDEYYNPQKYDPILMLVLEEGGYEKIVAKAPAYVNLWFSLGVRYPFEYLKAWVDQTEGYWGAGYCEYGIGTMGYEKCENPFGISEKKPTGLFADLTRSSLENMKEGGLLSLLICIGLVTWLLLLMLVRAIACKRTEWPVLLLLLAMVLTLALSTPIVSEFRYAYSLYTALPILLAAAMLMPGNNLCKAKEAIVGNEVDD